MAKVNPLSDRGKAAEEKWAREQDAKRLEELRKKSKKSANEPADAKPGAPAPAKPTKSTT